jgi:DNA-binding PadR family transcriptional regulator
MQGKPYRYTLTDAGQERIQGVIEDIEANEDIDEEIKEGTAAVVEGN